MIARLSNASVAQVGMACLFVAAVGWGLNWVAVKSLVPVMPPLYARGTAGLAAAALLATIALARGENLGVPRASRRKLAIASITNVLAWMGFSALSILWLRVAEAALLVYSMPIWATVISWAMAGARPRVRTLVALAISAAGVGLLLGGGPLSFGVDKLPGVGLALAAAILFAVGAVTSPGALGMSPIARTAWQLALGCAPLVAASLLFEQNPNVAIGPVGWLAWGYMALGPMAICYFAWFAAVKRLSPEVAATGMLLAPAIGALASAPLLGEPLGLRDVAAFALTLSGVALVLRTPPVQPEVEPVGREIHSSGN